MRPLAIAVLVGIPIVFGTGIEGAPDDPACPDVKGWWLGILMAWFVAVVALAVVALIGTRGARGETRAA